MTKDSEPVATTTQGQSEQSAKYKVGDRVLYGRTQCEVAGVRVQIDLGPARARLVKVGL